MMKYQSNKEGKQYCIVLFSEGLSTDRSLKILSKEHL
jgi:hypothetical protein